MRIGGLVLVGCVALWSAGAAAGDGVVEINQARALAGGVTATDAPGFPVTIDAPGSYRLTGNLDRSKIPGAEQVHGIEVLTGAVAIDLGGFVVLGSTVCAGNPPGTALSCAPVGFGRGVAAGGRNAIRVSNGAVIGSGNIGIECGAGCLVTEVLVENSGSSGIVTGDAGVIRGNTARRNGFVGINIALQSVGGRTIQGNAVFENGASGIYTGDGDLVEGNSSMQNRALGIIAAEGSLVRGNTATQNFQDGIGTGSRVLVIDNVSTQNTGLGLFLTPTAAYGRNLVGGNTGGSVFGGVEIAPNFCDTNTVCP